MPRDVLVVRKRVRTAEDISVDARISQIARSVSIAKSIADAGRRKNVSSTTTTWYIEPIGRETQGTNEALASELPAEDFLRDIDTAAGKKNLWRVPSYEFITRFSGMDFPFRTYRKRGGGKIEPIDLSALRRKKKAQNAWKNIRKAAAH